MGQQPIRSQHVFSHCVTGPVVGGLRLEPHLSSSSARLSFTEQSTVWNSSTASLAQTARPECGGTGDAQ